MENFVERHRETPVENPVKPLDHAAKSIIKDATTLGCSQQKLYNERVDKNGPEGATNTRQGLTTSNELAEDGLDMIVSEIPAWIATKDIAITYLEFAHQDYQNSRDMRIFYAKSARALGVTLREIADIYQMTTEGVRIMLKRAGEQ